MAYSLDLVDAPITCHAWNKDGTQLALCPNTSDLLIYEVKGKTTKLLYTLSEHTQVISSCDWNYVTGQIVTCSHDRNAYVWEFDANNNIWKKSLVLLKLNRAATYVRWAPDGKKFTVATGTSKFRICTYDPKQNWWQSYNIKNGHSKASTSLNVEFANDNIHVICGGTDRHFGYFTIDENDAKIKKVKGEKEIDWCKHDYSAQGWVNACTMSPSNQWLVYTSQDAYIKFISFSDLDGKGQSMNISGLPFLSLQFIGDKALIGGGFDCQPRLFALIGDKWVDKGFIDIEGIREKAASSSGGGLAAKRAMFGGAKVTKVETLHNNIIVGLRRHGDFISTCANDGKIGIWPISALKEHFKDVSFE